MKKVTLTRLDSSDQGTFGKIKIDSLVLFSGELPRRENKNNVSCIPSGLYQVVWTFSPRFKRFMYEVLNVPQRSAIRKHSANLMGDSTLGFKAQLNGCIALGEKLGYIDKQKALLLSAPAMRRFENFMERKPFLLEVTYA